METKVFKNVQLTGLQGGEVWYPETSVDQVKGLDGKLKGVQNDLEGYVEGVKNLILGDGELSKSFDTLKEVADWIEGHQVDAGDLITSVSNLETKVSNLETKVDNINGEDSILTILDHQVESIQTSISTLTTIVEQDHKDRFTNIEDRLEQLEQLETRLKALEDAPKSNVKAVEITPATEE